MGNALSSAQARLLARAVLSGIAAFVAFEQASDQPLSTTVIIGALWAAGHAALEYITPLNALVGLFKNPPQ